MAGGGGGDGDGDGLFPLFFPPFFQVQKCL